MGLLVIIAAIVGVVVVGGIAISLVHVRGAPRPGIQIVPGSFVGLAEQIDPSYLTPFPGHLVEEGPGANTQQPLAGPAVTSGVVSRGGIPLSPDEAPKPEVVTAVLPGVVEQFIGASSYAERLRHLKRLRDEGVLVHSRNRLQQKVRGQGDHVLWAYVFRGDAESVPRIEPPPRKPDEPELSRFDAALTHKVG